MLYLGIDQHRKQLTVNVRNEEGDVVLKRQVSTEWARVRAFFAELRELSLPAGGFVAILEVCGFNDWLLKMLPEYGCRETLLVQPTKQDQHKTDRRDANALSELLWINRARLLAGKRIQGLRRIVLPSPEDAEARRLTQLHCNLVGSRTATINQVQHMLLRHNLQQECPAKCLQTQKARKWLREVPLSELDRLEMNHLLRQWQLWDEQLVVVDRMIGDRQQRNANALLIATMPGAGTFNSLALAAHINGIDRFETPHSLPHYFGLTPGSRNSGEKTQRIGSITKQGSTMARFVLGQMTLHVLRKDARTRKWYQGIKKRRGSKIARVAVMRRLATIIWHMLKKRQPFCSDPEQRQTLQFVQPPAIRQPAAAGEPAAV